jgi:hypothetical protein
MDIGFLQPCILFEHAFLQSIACKACVQSVFSPSRKGKPRHGLAMRPKFSAPHICSSSPYFSTLFLNPPFAILFVLPLTFPAPLDRHGLRPKQSLSMPTSG